MRRFYALGLCLAAMIAIGALAASSASAEGLEWGQCNELTKTSNPKAKHGKYEEGNCQKEFEKKGKKEAKGNFEWYPGPSSSCEAKKDGKYKDAECKEEDVVKGKPKGKFERRACYGENGKGCAGITAEGGTAFLEGTSSHIKIECAHNGSEKGEITGPKSAKGIGTYKGCHIEALGGVTCTSAGAAKGEIKTFPLESEPVEVENSNKEKVIAIHYTNEHGEHAPYLAEFACEVVTIRVHGFADGTQTGGINEMGLTSTETFAGNAPAEKGAPQELISESNTGKGFENPEKSYQHQSSTFTSADAPRGMELKT
jgi:hypothetical protein